MQQLTEECACSDCSSVCLVEDVYIFPTRRVAQNPFPTDQQLKKAVFTIIVRVFLTLCNYAFITHHQFPSTQGQYAANTTIIFISSILYSCAVHFIPRQINILYFYMIRNSGCKQITPPDKQQWSMVSALKGFHCMLKNKFLVYHRKTHLLQVVAIIYGNQFEWQVEVHRLCWH